MTDANFVTLTPLFACSEAINITKGHEWARENPITS